MSLNSYAAPLAVRIEPSRCLTMLLIAAHLGAALLPFAVAMHPLLRLTLMIAVAVSFRRSWQQQRGRERITHMVWATDDTWSLARADGQEQTGVLRGESLLSYGVLVLGFDTDRGYRAVVLLNDSIDPENLRRLRVRLRLHAWRGSGAVRKLRRSG